MEVESIGAAAHKNELDAEWDYLLDTLNENDILPPVDILDDVNDVFSDGVKNEDGLEELPYRSPNPPPSISPPRQPVSPITHQSISSSFQQQQQEVQEIQIAYSSHAGTKVYAMWN